MVTCDHTHLIQIAGKVVLQDTDDYPTRGASVYEARCIAMVSDLIGKPLQKEGRFAWGDLSPTDHGYADGDRDVWCAAEVPDQQIGQPFYGAHQFVPFTGDVRGASQTETLQPGTCLSYRRGPGSHAACDQPHSEEIIGSVQLRENFKLPDVSNDAGWRAVAGPQCAVVSYQYAGGQLPTDGWTRARPIPQWSWDEGNRRVDCAIDTPTDSLTGSLKRSH